MCHKIKYHIKLKNYNGNHYVHKQMEVRFNSDDEKTLKTYNVVYCSD